MKFHTSVFPCSYLDPVQDFGNLVSDYAIGFDRCPSKRISPLQRSFTRQHVSILLLYQLNELTDPPGLSKCLACKELELAWMAY